MIYWELLWAFLKVGVFSFGGAYGAIPLIRDVVLSYNWMTEEKFTYFVAVSESTPGPIMVNLATYIGSDQAGLPGALIATTSVVLPSFIVILIIASCMKNTIKNQYVQAALKGIKPCFIGIILSMGIYMVGKNLLFSFAQASIDWQAILITATLLATPFFYKKHKQKELSPIWFIIISAGMGIWLY